ncbi:hypothetical protein K504DRAFT_384402 [Pleomassaria siparia CBS 279.74]|uniref:Large ribosomal subunit protein mL49 n=1 Tax=Pleomassaria siparia CBS 279.74 TaxID=1314801 RepID=A0A6G1K3A8_9PLEO|nr:hypothetical protein K504DRAFT_384402 [Pleomassaria siparia CBS 279.74]
MSRVQPLLPFLRPLAAPKVSASRQHFRFSTVSRLYVDRRRTKPYNPSRFQEPGTYAATNKTSIFPQAPKLSKAKAMKLRPLKSTVSGPQYPAPIPADLPPPRYHISRSHNNNYPIYTDFKRGGNLHLTTIRKITGDLAALRDELRLFLNKKDDEVKINQLTAHVVIKGHHVLEITEYLKARGL